MVDPVLECIKPLVKQYGCLVLICYEINGGPRLLYPNPSIPASSLGMCTSTSFMTSTSAGPGWDGFMGPSIVWSQTRPVWDRHHTAEFLGVGVVVVVCGLTSVPYSFWGSTWNRHGTNSTIFLYPFFGALQYEPETRRKTSRDLNEHELFFPWPIPDPWKDILWGINVVDLAYKQNKIQ